MMECKQEKKTFHVVGIKGQGPFHNFGEEVPKLARQFFERIEEVGENSGIEIALYEPKRDAHHLEGYYYVGVIVNEPLKEVPPGLDFITLTHPYVSIRGQITDVGHLHKQLLDWANEQGYNRDLEGLIVETYHPLANGQEEVEIYLPVI